MAPKIFATGATGYIGGSALDTIITAHPDYAVTALVRSESKAALLKAKYPHVATVLGDLDSADVITAEVSKADIVLHFADCDHLPSAKAITAALSLSTKDVFLIHTSGAAILPDVSKSETFGQAPTASERYSDVASVAQLTSWPEAGHLHRDVDSIVLASPARVHTAIVCPPTIYGAGTGAGNVRSNQVPELTKASLARGQAFQVGEGKSVWNHVHVADLSELYLLLTEAAAAGGKGADWDAAGYYFAENGTHVWGELAARIAEKAVNRGLLKTSIVQSLSVEDTKKIHPFGPVLWGTNSVGSAERARKVLGWTPKGTPLVDTLDQVIELEAKALGKL